MSITQDDLLDHHVKSLDLVEEELTRRYGERYTAYRKRYSDAGVFRFEPEFPLYLMLEQTYRCNLKCPSCIHGIPDSRDNFNTNISIMPWSLFERIILEGEKHGCPSIAFHVNDEPLMVRDLPGRVTFARDHGFMDLFMTTNGVLLNPEMMKSLIEGGITRILFSLDAATPETYERVRPNGDFSVVMNNLEALLEYKKAKGLVLPAVRVSFVVTSLNAHERELFIETFSDRVDYLEIQGFSTYYDINSALIPTDAEHIKEFSCNEPWRKLIIRANGDVLPCCTFYGYEIVLGNILQTSLKEIFQGKQCHQLRQEFKKRIYCLSPCAACSKSFYTT